MERWEYQVIHLNVEPPAPAPAPPSQPPPPAAPPAIAPGEGAPPIRVEAVFSKEYLEKEFPGFYGAPSPPGAPAREHPATQLRGFLNLQGRDGWQLVGFYPVGQLQMMIFRRPLLVEASEAPAAAVAPPPVGDPDQQPASASHESGSPPPVEGAPQAPAPALEAILERLAALERRLPSPPDVPPLTTVTAAGSGQPPALDALQDGEILPPERLSVFDAQPRLSTPEAARALGFRSAASLLNLAARSGYRQGLVKRGVHGAVAVYMGSEKTARGGRDRRLWVVLKESAA
jgi:hypothetical protein